MSFTNNFDGPQLSPQITLRKGPVEIKVQNAAAVIKRINELTPGSTYETCKRNRIVEERDRWQRTAKDWFRKEMFGGDEEDFEVVVSDIEPPCQSINSSEPQLVQSVNKNAYEIRLEVLQEATKWLTLETVAPSTTPELRNGDAVITLAQKFYKFVENRR